MGREAVWLYLPIHPILPNKIFVRQVRCEPSVLPPDNQAANVMTIFEHPYTPRDELLSREDMTCSAERRVPR